MRWGEREAASGSLGAVSNIRDAAKGTLCHLTGDSFLFHLFVQILPIDTRETEILFSHKVIDI